MLPRARWVLETRLRCWRPPRLPPEKGAKLHPPLAGGSEHDCSIERTFTHLPLSGSPQVFHGGVWDSWPASLLATWTVLPSYVFFANKKARTFSGPGFFTG